QIRHLSAAPSAEVISQFDYTYTQGRNIATWEVTQNGVLKKWEFGRDEAQRLTDAVRRDAGGGVLETERYGYDRVGNRTQVTTGVASPVVHNYAVNNLNQLTSERGFGPTTFSGSLDEPASVTVEGTPAEVNSMNGSAPFHFKATIDLEAGLNVVTVEATDGNDNTRTQQYEVTAAGEAT